MITAIAIGTVYMSLSVLGSAIYILYLQPLSADIVFDLIYLCYLSPSIIIQDILIANPVGSYVSTIIDALQSYCWSVNSLSQVSLALNRFIVTVLHRTTFFTPNRVIVFSIIQHLLALAITAAVQFVLPCCSIAFSYEDYGYREVSKPGVPNYVFAYVSMPVKVGCATIPLVIYCMILVFARAHAIRFKLQSPELRKRRRKELRFSAQFASIALVYTFSSFSFNLLMVISRSDSDWIKGIPVILGLLNSMSNGVVYLMNEKGKRSAGIMTASTSSDLHHKSNMLRIKKRLLNMVKEARMRLAHFISFS